MIIKVREMEDVIRDADDRWEMGARKYGDCDPDADSRDYFREMEEELLDFINYARVQIIRIRRHQQKVKQNHPVNICPECEVVLQPESGTLRCPVCGEE